MSSGSDSHCSPGPARGQDDALLDELREAAGPVPDEVVDRARALFGQRRADQSSAGSEPPPAEDRPGAAPEPALD